MSGYKVQFPMCRLHLSVETDKLCVADTVFPAYSDTLGTIEKRHSKKVSL